MAKYLDQAALKIFITKLTGKYDERYLGLHAVADAAKKVTNAFTVNVGGKAVVFDGSVAESADVAAAEHTHLAEDITDFKTAVRKEVFGEGAGDGVVGIHQHTNVGELEKIANGDVAIWHAKIGTADVGKLAYSNDNMSNVANVKAALDVLAVNVVRTAGLLDLNGKAMQDVEKKVVDNATAITEMKNEAVANSLANRIKALENANAEGGAVTKAIGAVEDKADAAQLQANKGVADAKAAQDDVDALEELVGDIEEGKTVAELIDANAQAAVAAQSAADKAQGEVDALEGVVAQFKTDQATKDGKQDEAINTKVAQAAYDVKVKALEDEDARIAGLVATEQGRAEGVEQELQAAIDVLNGDTEGSVNKKIADAIDEVNGAAATLEGRVAANESKLAVIQGVDTVPGSIAKAEKDAKAYADTQDTVTLQAAKDYADGKITALVDSAPDAMNTLGELAKAINDHQDVYDAYVDTVTADIAKAKGEAIADAASKDAALKAELQGKIDNDVTALGSAIRGEMAAETTRVNKKIADDIAAESALRQTEEADIRSDFAAADSVLSARIAAFEGNGAGSVAAQVKAVQDDLDAFELAQAAVDQGQDKKIADLEAKFAGENSVDAKIAAVQAEVDTEEERAAAAEAALDLKIAAINNKDTGILKQAKDYADAQDTAQYKAIAAEIDKDVKVVADELAKQKDAGQEGTLAAQIAANTAALQAIGRIEDNDIDAAIREVFTNL